MLRLTLGAALIVHAATVEAQPVPARDLLTYPLGLVGVPAALGAGAASGMWNPATALLGSGERARLAASGLSSPIDLAFTGQVLHAALVRARLGTVSLGVVRAAITDLVHTETDPQSVGNDIPYGTWVLSLGVARRVREHVVLAGALRWHTGHVATRRKSVLATDAGVVFDGLTSRDIRIGASSFLFTFDSRDTPTFAVAADARLAGRDTLRMLRGGIGLVSTRDASREQYPFLDARAGKLNVRGGPVRVTAYGTTTWRLRLAVELRHAGYTIGIVREDNENGLAPTYQLGIANVFR
jgi:hypothetical protein